MNDLQNRGFMINYMKDIECISRIPLGFALEVCKSQSVWTIQKTRALNSPPSHGNFGDVQEATDILVKNLAIGPQS
jgi:hypothetical protein